MSIIPGLEPEEPTVEDEKNVLSVVGATGMGRRATRKEHKTLAHARSRVAQRLVIPYWRELYERGVDQGKESTVISFQHGGAAIYQREAPGAEWVLVDQIEPGPYLWSKWDLPWNERTRR